jgi:hypothetical protein
VDIARGIEILVPDARYKRPILEETQEFYNSLEWLDERVKPTWNEIYTAWTNAILIENINNCKYKAKELISKCDWSVLPDVNLQNKLDFESYRSKLRELIVNPVENPVFPIEPDPIWSN